MWEPGVVLDVAAERPPVKVKAIDKQGALRIPNVEDHYRAAIEIGFGGRDRLIHIHFELEVRVAIIQ